MKYWEIGDDLILDVKALSEQHLSWGSDIHMMETLFAQRAFVKVLRSRGCYPPFFLAPLGAQLEVTYKCNLRCYQCYNNSWRQMGRPELSDEDWSRIARELSSLRIFECIISGGEPLIRRATVERILEEIEKCDPKIIFITNGWFFDRDFAKILKRLSMRYIQISIDGYCPEIHDSIRGREGSYDRAVKAAMIAKEERLPLCVAHTVLPENLPTLDKMIDLALAIGAEQIIADFPLYTGSILTNLPNFSEEDHRNFYRIIREKRQTYHASLSILTSYEPAVQLRLYALEPNKVLLIRPNGDLKLDCITPFTFGNARTKSIAEIWTTRMAEAWQHPRVLEFISSVKSVDNLVVVTPRPHLDEDEPL